MELLRRLVSTPVGLAYVGVAALFFVMSARVTTDSRAAHPAAASGFAIGLGLVFVVIARQSRRSPKGDDAWRRHADGGVLFGLAFVAAGVLGLLTVVV